MSKKSKNNKLESARSLFQEMKVLQIADLMRVFGIRSRRSVLRYMKEMDYLVDNATALRVLFKAYQMIQGSVSPDRDGLATSFLANL